MKPLWLSLEPISERLRRETFVHVGCDYDGTITPIVEHPDLAGLPDRVRETLSGLANIPGARVAIISGRRLDDLGTRVGIRTVYLAGCGGLETQNADGRRERHVPPDRELPIEMRDVMNAWCGRFEGAWLEEKDLTFALHYRAVPARFRPAFCAGVRRRLVPYQTQARVLHGKSVFEVLPCVAWGKAESLFHWQAQAREPGALFYFGDDANDEPVYERVADRGGYGVAVGRTASRAEYSLASTEDVLWFLEWLERERRATSVPAEMVV
jgi:trehalose-phosphatase